MNLVFKKLQLRVSTFVLFSSVFIPGEAQELSVALPEVPWHIQSSRHATGNYYSPSSFRRSILYLPDGGVLASIRDINNKGGVAYIGTDGKPKWKTALDGCVTGIGRMGNNVIVSYSDGENFSTGFSEESKTVFVALLNSKTGKLIQSKKVYQHSKEVYIDSRSINRADGSFSKLLIRVADYAKAFGKTFDAQELLLSRKLLLVDIDTSLNIVTKEIQTEGKDGKFIGAEPGPGDNLFICTSFDTKLLVERFGKDGKLLDKISTLLETGPAWFEIEPMTMIHPENPEVLLIGLAYSNKKKDRTNQVFEINMSTKKITGSGEQVLNKSYKKSLEFSEADGIKEDNGDPSSLKVMNIAITKERIAVVKSAIYSYLPRPESHFYKSRCDAIVIDIYDRGWKLIKSVALNKIFESNTPIAQSVGAKAIGETLHILAPAFQKPASAVNIYAQIDLLKPQVITFKKLPWDESFEKKRKYKYLIQGDASIWLPDGVWIEHLVVHNEGLFTLVKQDYSSIWQKIKF